MIERDVVKLRMDFLDHQVAAHIQEGEPPIALDYPELNGTELMYLDAIALWLANDETLALKFVVD